MGMVGLNVMLLRWMRRACRGAFRGIRGSIAVLGVLLFVEPASAEKRVALVVGNSEYKNVSPLDNPRHDAKLIAETLRNADFVIVGGAEQVDLDKSGMDKVIQDFGTQLSGADVALFYYAGHGLQVRGSNYMVPVTANPTKEADVDFQMVDVNLVLRQMEGAGTKLNLLVLDACRNNPFAARGLRSSSSGLAQMTAPEGTLISYATQPGNVAQDGGNGNSPYTFALAQSIKRTGLDIFQTFNEVGLAVKRATRGQQQPWLSSSPIDGSFYFSGQSVAVGLPSMVEKPSAAIGEAAEAWSAVKDATNPALFDAFLKRYPASFFSELARVRLEELKLAAAPVKPKANPQVSLVFPPLVAGGPAPLADISPAPLSSAPQRVVLYDEDPAQPKGMQYVGSVTWRTEPVKGMGNLKPEIAVRGEITIPERKLNMTLLFRKNADSSLPASHIAELTFTLPQDFVGGGVSNVPGVLMKTNEQARGTPLAGLAVKVTEGFFLVGLSNVESDRQRNMQLLQERSWFDIPIVYSNQRRAIIAIDKGGSGDAAFRAVLAAPAADPAMTGGYVVQVGSQRSEADAQAAYRALRGKFPNIFGNRPFVIRRADLGEKGAYYRASVGPFATSDEASEFCGSLKSAGGQCVVQRN